MFDRTSRYATAATTMVTDHRGRTVTAVLVPDPPQLTVRGEHLRRQGQRLDHLANFYLGDPHGYWQIAELADVVLPETLSEVGSILIPIRR